MKPLIWDIPDDFKERCIMDYKWRERSTDSSIFMGGKHLPCADVGGLKYSKDPKEYDLIFASRVSPKEFTKFDCLPNNSTAPLVNQKVLNILNKLCPNDIQAFPAVIMPESGSPHSFENRDYWVINIIKLVEAINLEKSVVSFYEEIPDRVSNIKKLVFIKLNVWPSIRKIAVYTQQKNRTSAGECRATTSAAKWKLYSPIV